MRSSIPIAVVVSALLMASALAVPAETGSVNGRSNLTRALQGASLPLESGLAVSAHEGTPLSAKYEIDDGAFQLSVYTSKTGPASADAFMEVVVDYSSGVVLKVKVETISNGGDLAAAQAQKAAMDRARRSLAEATADAVKANAGYRAVSAMPSLDNGHPVAEVTLVHGDDWKVVIEPLD
jgi:hypothetical protein